MADLGIYLLILMYSPTSEYFSGFDVEQKASEVQCVAEAQTRIGEPLKTKMAWEVEMMGPQPKVIAAFCARGSIAK